MTAQVGLIGAGNIGFNMLRHFVAAGCRVSVFDVSPSVCEAAAAAGAEPAETVADIGRRCGVIISSLPNAAALDAVCAGLAGAASGAVLVETSTLPLDVKSRARAVLEQGGITMLDAPVSGTGAQAASKDIAVLASGDRDAFDRALPVLDHVARSIHYLGPFGAGMRMKLLANHLVAVHSLAAAEVLALADRVGIAPALAVTVLNDGAGASRMLAVRGPAMAARRFDPVTAHLDILLKDLDMIEDMAATGGASLPLLERAADIYRTAGRKGWGRRDISEMFLYLQHEDGSTGSGERPR